jgi:serine/threonine protein kinase
MCATCGKRVAAGRAGSFTQWIFRQDLCGCAEPNVVAGSQTDSGSYVPQGPEEYIDENEEALDVGPREFPLDRYKPLSILGEGVSGRVYLSRDRILGKKVAVKTLRQLSPAELVQFQHAARANSKLTHPMIVQVLDFGVSNQTLPFMVMDFVPGRGLDEIRQTRGYLPWETVFNIMIDLCDALAYAHESGVFHRDLKLSNIIVDRIDSPRPSICLIDFGVAQIGAEPIPGNTISGSSAIVGTPAYMSPDTSTGLNYTARSDIYSLGCVMFECITGRPPFLCDTALETLQMHAEKEPPAMASLNHSITIPDEVQKVVSKCLEKRPNNRFQSVTELKIALKRVLRGEGRNLDVKRVRESDDADPAPSMVAGVKAETSATFVITTTVVALLALGAVVAVVMYKPPKPVEVYKKPVKQKTATEITRSSEPRSFTDLFEVDKNEKGHFTATRDLIDSDLELLLGRDVTSLTMPAQHDITDKGCKILARMPLAHLLLTETKITDRGAKRLAEIDSLRGIGLGRARLTDAAIFAFSDKIINFAVPDSLITDKCMSHIAKMKDLAVLNISGTEVTDAGIAQLKDVPLRELYATNCKLSDASLFSLAASKANLQVLVVPGSNISEAGIRAIRRMPLTEFDAGMCKNFDDNCIKLVADSFPQLTSLSIEETSITPEAIKVIGTLKNLHFVRLSHLKFTDEEFEPLLDLKELDSVDFSATQITDKFFLKLLKLPKLHEVVVNDCRNLTETAMKTAQKKKGLLVESARLMGLEAEPEFTKFLDIQE